MTTAAARLDHIAFLVPDLPTAITAWESMFGISFGAVSKRTMQLRHDGKVIDTVVHNAFASIGRMSVELLEASGDDVLGGDQPYGFHHVGVRAAHLEAGGEAGLVEHESIFAGGRRLAWFAGTPSMPGVRVEVA
ncbi:hypothetical protein HH310_14820 [Actinoplanes sp. TBRC 11911]|uniref:VOC family protein n=1 Tax=Actinoplanes sp. TBRC 11911 TaxID=2729386 RepID=UPI00145C4D31|nr:VOC family protein [Actinoplanes sp. TBRC 11911]NMO52460.1 hypothetical protein [Actinoplanes sp. TBRC 11911]